MFRLFSRLCLEYWTSKGEKKLSDRFKKTYIDGADRTPFFYCCLGVPGISPQNNSLEQCNLDIKGSRFMEGIINQGNSITRMFRQQFPKMVHVLSVERSGFYREYVILDKNKCFGICGEEISALDIDLDVKRQDDGSYLVNDGEFVGVDITPERIQKYKDSILGLSKYSAEDRHMILEDCNQFCRVSLSNVNGIQCYTGSCLYFWKNMCCPHSAFFQHRGDLADLQKLPTRKSSRKRGKGDARNKTSKDRNIKRRENQNGSDVCVATNTNKETTVEQDSSIRQNDQSSVSNDRQRMNNPLIRIPNRTNLQQHHMNSSLMRLQSTNNSLTPLDLGTNPRFSFHTNTLLGNSLGSTIGGGTQQSRILQRPPTTMSPAYLNCKPLSHSPILRDQRRFQMLIQSRCRYFTTQYRSDGSVCHFYYYPDGTPTHVIEPSGMLTGTNVLNCGLSNNAFI